MNYSPLVRDERAAAGLCTDCGECPPAPNRKMCPACLKVHRDKWRKRSAARKAKGLCVRCGKQPARPKRNDCAECAANTSARYDHAKGRALAAKRYRARIAAGLCTKCGKVEPRPDQRLCATCAAKAYRYETNHKAARRAKGQCTGCGSPAQVGYATCQRCRAKQRHYDAKHQAVPIWQPGFTVYDLASGDCLGTYDSREDVALCLAFAKLDRDAVEIVTDAPAIFGMVGWS